MSLETLVKSNPSRKALLNEFTSYWGARKAISASSGDEQQALITWCLAALEDATNPRAERMKLALVRMQKQETPIQETFSLDTDGNLTQAKAKKDKKSETQAETIQAKATSASSDREALATEILEIVMQALAAKGL